MRSTRCVHRSMSGNSLCWRGSLWGEATGGAGGLAYRLTVAGVLGREIRGTGVGILLQAIIVSVDTRDTVSTDLPVPSVSPCWVCALPACIPLGPASSRSCSLISIPVVAISSGNDSDLTTVTSKCVEVVDDDYKRLWSNGSPKLCAALSQSRDSRLSWLEVSPPACSNLLTRSSAARTRPRFRNGSTWRSDEVVLRLARERVDRLTVLDLSR